KLSTTTLPSNEASCSAPGAAMRRSEKSGAVLPTLASFPEPCASFQISSASSDATSPTARICAPSLSRVAMGSARDDEDRRPDRHVVEEPLRVGDVHANAPVRGGVADRGV